MVRQEMTPHGMTHLTQQVTSTLHSGTHNLAHDAQPPRTPLASDGSVYVQPRVICSTHLQPPCEQQTVWTPAPGCPLHTGPTCAAESLAATFERSPEREHAPG